MSNASPKETLREAVGIFDNAEALESAVDDLLSSGFNRAEISLLAAEKTVEEKLGHKYSRVQELEDDSRVPRTAFLSTASLGDAEGGLVGGLLYVGAVAAAGVIVATGGTLATAIVGAVTAGSIGAGIGEILAAMIQHQHAKHLHEQLDKGGLLLWVWTRDVEHERRAVDILSRHSAHDVHVHDVPVGRST